LHLSFLITPPNSTMTPFFNNDAVSGESAVGSLLSFLGLMLYLLGLLLYLLGSFLALLGSLLSWFGTLFSWTSALVTILFSTTLRVSDDVESGRGQFSTPYFGACLPRRLIIWLMIDFKDLALSGITTLTWLRCGKSQHCGMTGISTITWEGVKQQKQSTANPCMLRRKANQVRQ
jgi:hypothetical protein